MMTIREYARPATLEEAWQLNQKKPNRVLGVCSVPSAVILYCKCADISAAVVGIAEIQLYGIIFTAAAVSDAYRNLLGSAAEINGAEADGRSSVKAAERASVYRDNGNI